MADIRELIILSPGILDPKPETPLASTLLDLKMTLRRAVVSSSRSRIVRRLYLAAYNAHLRLAAMLGRRFAGTDAVYLTSGMATGEINIGVSDIDLAFYGSWPEDRQFRLMKIFGLFAILSPLFDKRSIASIGTVEDLKCLCATDMTYALVHAKGRLQWKLLQGENVLDQLPGIAAVRFAGCVYMDVRRWWSTLANLVFGNDVTTRDRIFQNTICFKAAAEMLRSERMLAIGQIDCSHRSDVVDEAVKEDGDPTLRLLQQSAVNRFLTIARDPRPSTLQWFLARSEDFHREIRNTPSFASAAAVTQDGTAAERLIASFTLQHANQIAAQARQQFPKLRAAYLVPAAVMFSPDSLALVLEVDGADVPGADVLRNLCAAHRAAAALPQRLALYLLLPMAAYQLDIGGALEFFQYTLTPETAPDVFAAFQQPETLLYGETRARVDERRWSHVAQELMLEELNARRGAYRRFGVLSRPSALENVRNLWRLLQLLAMERTAAAGEIVLPTTVAAILRATLRSHPELSSDLNALLEVHEAALQHGQEIGGAVNDILQRVYTAVTGDPAVA